MIPAVRTGAQGRDVAGAVAVARQVLGLHRRAWFGVLHRDPDGTAWHLTLAEG